MGSRANHEATRGFPSCFRISGQVVRILTAWEGFLPFKRSTALNSEQYREESFAVPTISADTVKIFTVKTSLQTLALPTATPFKLTLVN